MSYSNTTVKDAVDISIKNEKNLDKFCKESLGAVDNSRGKYVLQYLRDYEKRHLDQLEQFKRKLIDEEVKFHKQDSSTPEDPGQSETFKRNSARIIELLKLSTAAEKKAMEVLSKLDSHIDDNEWKESFSKLVEEEHLHNKVLFDEFYNISNREGVYHWGD